MTWLLNLGLYLAFVTQTGFRELIAGGISAAIATLAVAVYVRQGRIRFSVRWADALQIFRTLPGIFSGTVIAIAAVVGRVVGKNSVHPLMKVARFAWTEDDPESAAKRALAISYTTLTPNSLVLGVLRESKSFLYHELKPCPIPVYAKFLGVGKGEMR